MTTQENKLKLKFHNHMMAFMHKNGFVHNYDMCKINRNDDKTFSSIEFIGTNEKDSGVKLSVPFICDDVQYALMAYYIACYFKLSAEDFVTSCKQLEPFNLISSDLTQSTYSIGFGIEFTISYVKPNDYGCNIRHSLANVRAGAYYIKIIEDFWKTYKNCIEIERMSEDKEFENAVTKSMWKAISNNFKEVVE